MGGVRVRDCGLPGGVISDHAGNAAVRDFDERLGDAPIDVHIARFPDPARHRCRNGIMVQ